jgi:hypothetical protein
MLIFVRGHLLGIGLLKHLDFFKLLINFQDFDLVVHNFGKKFALMFAALDSIRKLVRKVYGVKLLLVFGFGLYYTAQILAVFQDFQTRMHNVSQITQVVTFKQVTAGD